MKKLINDPQDVLAESLLGIEAARPEVRVDHATVTVLQADEELVRLWDSPVNTAGLRWGI